MDFSDIFPFAVGDGYIILALVNFFGSLIPFVPLPGFLLLATMSIGNEYDLHILALVSAVSATAAKQIIFYVSFKGRKIISKKTLKRMRPFQRLVTKYGAAAAFVAAATPMPDDIIFVPLGLAKYNPKRFFISTLVGKIVLSYSIVFLYHYLGLSVVEPLVKDLDSATPIYIGVVVFGVMMTLVIVLLLRLDWARILGKFLPWTLDENNDDELDK
ncbi:MAG: DedA family protein [Nitrosopumilus sp.]|jgi:membrane protein DedA with SNARE-associated domain|nr:DedA family protein [Nitrosopumilus sp.]MBT3685795.1 DedA family protein [Nitrosopumilus sp.]MBT3925303.1 DedA family protein [Nitrosopumilus sp.]MBT4216187.1 DedA family protein [Nitrosopumilus sp.]MBT4550515.1 DedA family protein [Nitrosopumilus sp.]